MKRILLFALIGLGILGIVYAYFHRQELGIGGARTTAPGDGAASGDAAASSHPARIEWQTVDRTPDGFKVDMPLDVKEIQIPAYNDSGGADQVSMIFANPDPVTTFSVSWADDPPVSRMTGRAPERVLDTARDDALARTQTSLVSENRVNLDGSPGRDFTARNAGGGVMDTRLVYAGHRLYMLTAAFPSRGARREQDVTRFFNSFKISATARP